MRAGLDLKSKHAAIFAAVTLFLLLVTLSGLGRDVRIDLKELEIEPYVCGTEGAGDGNELKGDGELAGKGRKTKYVELGRRDEEGGSSCRGNCELVKPYPGLCVVQGSDREKQVVNKMHCLPSLLIVGVMKGGTGAMMKRLNEHPMLQSGKGDDDANEVHYFTKVVGGKGNSDSSASQCPWLSYARHFSVIPPPAPENGQALVPLSFDKSPDYIRSPAALKKMREILPTIKLLVLLRDPVRRAISAFNHHCRHGRYWSIQSRGPANARVRASFKPKQVFLLLSGGDGRLRDNNEIRGPTVLRIEWLLKQAKAGTLMGCDRDADASTCKTLAEGDISDYFGRLKYPCSADRYRDYIKSALPVEHGGELGVSSYESSESRKEIVSGAVEELTFGFYKAQITAVLETFPALETSKGGAHGQVKVLFQENMYQDTLGAVNEVVEWMGLTPMDTLKWAAASSPSTVSSAALANDFKRGYSELYSGLQSFYAQQNKGLLSLLRERGLYKGSTPPPAWVE